MFTPSSHHYCRLPLLICYPRAVHTSVAPCRLVDGLSLCLGHHSRDLTWRKTALRLDLTTLVGLILVLANLRFDSPVLVGAATVSVVLFVIRAGFGYINTRVSYHTAQSRRRLSILYIRYLNVVHLILVCLTDAVTLWRYPRCE